MYVLNTILRLIRFVSNSFIGLAVGFLLGYLFSNGSLANWLDKFL